MWWATGSRGEPGAIADANDAAQPAARVHTYGS